MYHEEWKLRGSAGREKVRPSFTIFMMKRADLNVALSERKKNQVVVGRSFRAVLGQQIQKRLSNGRFAWSAFFFFFVCVAWSEFCFLFFSFPVAAHLGTPNTNRHQNEKVITSKRKDILILNFPSYPLWLRTYKLIDRSID